MSQTSEQIRKSVETAYGDMIEKASNSCGCGTTPLVNYESEKEVTSFGCGNPLAFAGVDAGQTVLDLGSGAGLDLIIAAEKVGPDGHVIGVDMTDRMIEKARENLTRHGVANAEVRKGIIEELPVDDASVDWVISNCVINLSPEKGRVFEQIARVLKPGGKFSISDIVVEDLPEWVRAMPAAYSSCISGAVSEAEYVEGLRAAGLENVEVTERVVYGPEQLCGVTGDERAGELAGKVTSIRVVGYSKENGALDPA